MTPTIILTFGQLTTAVELAKVDVDRNRQPGEDLDQARHLAVLLRQARAAVEAFLGKPVPPHVVVRAVAWNSQGLLQKQTDDPSKTYLSVLVRPPFFMLRGWLSGAACRRPEWWRTPAGRRPCWVVPPTELATMDTLQV